MRRRRSFNETREWQAEELQFNDHGARRRRRSYSATSGERRSYGVTGRGVVSASGEAATQQAGVAMERRRGEGRWCC